ncbi:MAG TPA: tetratricopeptide repeat protein, partial [Rhizomicrobium sp.]
MASYGGTSAQGRDAANDAKTVGEIIEAARAGDVPRAMDMAREALHTGLIHPLLLNLRAYWLETQGRDEEALADLRRAVFMAPKDPLIQNSYGLCLSKLNRRPEAVAAFRAAVTSDPNFGHAHFNLGMALEREGEIETAQKSYERAAELMPDFVEPPARIAGLAGRTGDWNKVRELGPRVLATDPKNAVVRMAMTRAALAADDLEGAEKFLPSMEGVDPAFAYERAIAHSLMGDLRHAQERFPEAFIAYEKGNAELKSIYATRYDGPGVETALNYVIWLAEQFVERPEALPPAQRNNAAGADGGAAGHVFLVGFPRSGTTL